MADAIPPGTLDLMILQTLARERELHGFENAAAIGTRSDDVFFVEEGSLYPALQRMLVKGWVDVEWGRTTEGRRARYYTITRGGRKQLQAELERFERVTSAVARVVHAT